MTRGGAAVAQTSGRAGSAVLGATPQAEGMHAPGTRDRVRPARSVQLTSQPLPWEPGPRGHCPVTWTQKGRRKRLELAACAQRACRSEISCLDGGGGLLLSRPDPRHPGFSPRRRLTSQTVMGSSSALSQLCAPRQAPSRLLSLRGADRG